MPESIEQHLKEIVHNEKRLRTKPLLKQIYKDFYLQISQNLSNNTDGLTVELGSGIADIKSVIPNCIRTDLFGNESIDQVENAYQLSFENDSVSNLILFDVFHHLRYPGTAFKEFRRVLKDDGHVIILEPYISLLGRIIFGLFHHEPIAMKGKIEWDAPSDWNPSAIDYYAAQGNATRIFFQNMPLSEWSLITKTHLSALAYAASGGYSGPQLYPDATYGWALRADEIFKKFPSLFATRCLVVVSPKKFQCKQS